MDVKEAKDYVGCLVRMSERDYNSGGIVYMLYAAWQEASSSKSIKCGVTLKCRTSDSYLEIKESEDLKPYEFNLIPKKYPRLKYIPERGNPLSVHEIMKLIGSVVSVDGKPVLLKRIYKKADEHRLVWYEVGIRDINFPNTGQIVPLRKIMRYTGEPPELPVMQNEKIAPLRKRQLEKEKAAAGINDTVRRCQAETLEHLKMFEVKR